jgi:hypothetical protein
VPLSSNDSIGSTGKYVGVGSQGIDHDRVAVAIPVGAGAEATIMVVQVSQTNTARAGDAFLYKNGPTDLGTLIGTCELDPATLVEAVTGCTVVFTSAERFLADRDALSCFVITDTGSYQSASCSVMVNLATAAPIP